MLLWQQQGTAWFPLSRDRAWQIDQFCAGENGHSKSWVANLLVSHCFTRLLYQTREFGWKVSRTEKGRWWKINVRIGSSTTKVEQLVFPNFGPSRLNDRDPPDQIWAGAIKADHCKFPTQSCQGFCGWELKSIITLIRLQARSSFHAVSECPLVLLPHSDVKQHDSGRMEEGWGVAYVLPRRLGSLRSETKQTENERLAAACIDAIKMMQSDHDFMKFPKSWNSWLETGRLPFFVSTKPCPNWVIGPWWQKRILSHWGAAPHRRRRWLRGCHTRESLSWWSYDIHLTLLWFLL